MLSCEISNHFSQDLLFIGCDIFPQVMIICLHLIKHIPLDCNTLVAPPIFYSKSKIVEGCHEM